MKVPALKDGRFVTDAKGTPVGVLLKMKAYERLRNLEQQLVKLAQDRAKLVGRLREADRELNRLREAEEDLADIRAYDAARPKVLGEVKAAQVSSLTEYRARRLRLK